MASFQDENVSHSCVKERFLPLLVPPHFFSSYHRVPLCSHGKFLHKKRYLDFFTKSKYLKLASNKKSPLGLINPINQTHGGTCLVLLPSGSDTLHKPTIVLAFRQGIVYRILLSLASPFLISFSLLANF